MKKVQTCIVENCIPTPTSCGEWNGGDIDYLGICNGDSLNNVVWEIVTKLEEIAGQDLSTFDLEGLIGICNQKAPDQKTLLNILGLIRDNQICLKDYITSLQELITDLAKEQSVDVDLKCLADLDNLGNTLNVSRDQLDQLVVNKLCNHESRIDDLEGEIVLIKSEISNLDMNKTVDELSFATCVDSGVKPTSTQVIALAEDFCDLQDATGDPGDISTALSKVGPDWNTEFGALLVGDGYILTPENLAQVFGNALLIIENLRARVEFMENNCCAATCDDVKYGFSAVFNEDMSGIIIKFTSGAGTFIPSGFTDLGSTGTIKDQDGNIESFSLTITNNYEIEIPITGLNTKGDLIVNITAKVGTPGLVCEKCLSKTVRSAACAYCEYTATGDPNASAVLIYDDGLPSSVVVTPSSLTTTTTSSTTTTTTGAM